MRTALDYTVMIVVLWHLSLCPGSKAHWGVLSGQALSWVGIASILTIKAAGYVTFRGSNSQKDRFRQDPSSAPTHSSTMCSCACKAYPRHTSFGPQTSCCMPCLVAPR